MFYTEELDGKTITELSRQFLINWKASKEARKKITEGRHLTGQTAYPFPGMDISFLNFFIIIKTLLNLEYRYV